MNAVTYRRGGAALAGAVALLAAFGAGAATPESDNGGSPLGYHFLADANRAEYHGHLTEALAFASKAVDNSPQFAVAYFRRATIYTGMGRYGEALADLERVGAMHPDAQVIFIWRAIVAIQKHDGKTALTELAHAGSLPPSTFWHRSFESGAGEEGGGHGVYQVVSVHDVSNMYAYRSIAFELVGQDDLALDDLDRAVKNETEQPWYVLGSHCYEAAIAGLLDMAELTCGQAIAKSPRDIGDYDSLGLVHLKQKAWDKAISDYDKSLAMRPDLTFSLYGRGLARRARGDRVGGDADVDAAKAGEPDIAGIMSRLGVVAN